MSPPASLAELTLASVDDVNLGERLQSMAIPDKQGGQRGAMAIIGVVRESQLIFLPTST